MFFVGLSLALFAQADLNSTLESLKNQLTEVETKSAVFGQTLEWDAQKPYKLKLTILETGKKKGKEKVSTFDFSLKDVDLNAIRSKTNKDIVEVNIFMKSKQKLVIFSQEGEFKSYVSQLKVYANDADSGKALEKIIEQAAKQAKAFPSSCPADATTGYTWMMDNVADFSVGDVAKEQSLKIDGMILDYHLVTKGKKDKVEHWFFNLADLNKRSVKLQIKSKEFYVEAKTKRNLKYIFYQKDESKSSYTNKIKFYTANFEQAKCLLSVLELLIEDSEKQMKANTPSFTSAKQALDVLAKEVGTVEMEKYKILQELKPTCATTLTQNETKGSSDAKDKEFRFNYLDVKAKRIEIGVKGNLVELTLGTGKDKLIQAYKDGELGSYTNKLTIIAPNIEKAKLMKIAAVDAAKLCKDEAGFKPFGSVKENFDWLAKLLKEHVVPEHEQRLEAGDEDCKWKLVSIQSGKKQLEEVFEFSLEDLDEKKIKWKISGKKLAIVVNAKYKEKNIKYYKNGEPDNYKNVFSIEFNDIEAARNAILVLKKAVELCKG